MKLSVVAVGRLKSAERELCERYDARLRRSGRPLGLDWRGCLEVPDSRGPTAPERMAAEAGAILSRTADASIVALDERGSICSSEQFAALLSRQRDDGRAALLFAIGGADGHGAEVLERAAHRVSLGRMTWPHGIARALLLEQLYRATTILSGHPYHRV